MPGAGASDTSGSHVLLTKILARGAPPLPSNTTRLTSSSKFVTSVFKNHEGKLNWPGKENVYECRCGAEYIYGAGGVYIRVRVEVCV